VPTNQHFSHAHDYGWPFPLWTQSDNHPDRVKGKTFGWHFQPLDKVPAGWVTRCDTGDAMSTSVRRRRRCGNWRNLRSLGIQDNRWRLEATGPSPAIVTPQGYATDAFNAPYLQLRWMRGGSPKDHALPYVEWQREGDAEFGPDRRVYFRPEKTPLSGEFYHSIMTMYRHPQWTGRIQRMRICLAPDESEGKFEVDSFFTVYDTVTRSTIPSSFWPARGTSTGQAISISCAGRSTACGSLCNTSRPSWAAWSTSTSATPGRATTAWLVSRRTPTARSRSAEVMVSGTTTGPHAVRVG